MSANPLEIYARELRRWNKAVNLVSPATLADLETRHIDDSAQLADHLPPHAITLMDWGSGGGLPGMILALLRPDDTVHFIESDLKKGEFLRHVSRETSRPVHIHSVRIEAVGVGTIHPHVLTARALAPLDKLLGWMLPFATTYPHLYALFSKGKNWAEELETAQKTYDFKVEIIPSRTDASARILRIENLTLKA